MQVGLASDHGGFELKEEIKDFLKSLGIEPIDMGTFDECSVDYPDIGALVAEIILTLVSLLPKRYQGENLREEFSSVGQGLGCPSWPINFQGFELHLQMIFTPLG